jgi:Calx-beta domain
MRRTVTALGLVFFAATTLVATSATAGAIAQVKPVIGKPVTSPRQLQAGKRATIAYKVTDDMGAPLAGARVSSELSSAGKPIAHTDTFARGTAKVSFVVPSSAKAVKIKLTVRSRGQSATKLSTFAVKGGVIPTLSVADASVNEGNSGTTTLPFKITLSSKSTDTVSVTYGTTNGTATSPPDYAPALGSLTFKPAETQKTLSISVVGDTLYEPDETLTVTLASPVNATIADGQATGTITNDDKLATPGHYSGKTSQTETFDFDVPDSGAEVTGLRTGQINQSCQVCFDFFGLRLCFGAGSTSEGRLNFGEDRFPIAQDKTFKIDRKLDEVVQDENGTTYPATTTVAIGGTFTDVAAASGTLLVVTSFTIGDEEWTCTSNPQTWAVTRPG